MLDESTLLENGGFCWHEIPNIARICLRCLEKVPQNILSNGGDKW